MDTKTNGAAAPAVIPIAEATHPLARNGAPPPLQSSRDLLGGVISDIAGWHKTRQAGGWTGGLRCGFPLIDTKLRGFRRASVTVLNAEPNIGKSTLTNQIAYQVAAFAPNEAAALVVSFENLPANLIFKHLSRLSGWEQADIESGEVPPNDPLLDGALQKIAAAPLFYVRGNRDVGLEIIIARIEQMKQLTASAQPFVVLDYLQYYARLIYGNKDGFDATACAIADMRTIADATGAALVVIGSQNREANKAGQPSMYGGKGNGDIEYDADYVLNLYDHATPPDDKSKKRRHIGYRPLTLAATKTRYGGVGEDQALYFNSDRAHFALTSDGKDIEE